MSMIVQIEVAAGKIALGQFQHHMLILLLDLPMNLSQIAAEKTILIFQLSVAKKCQGE